MLRNFLEADECFYVMENGSKIKIDSSVKSEKLVTTQVDRLKVEGF
jgi:hypothetical protein